MNADRFLALYDRVADAPDAVGRLRRFVLDLAVRGKLVEQDPADEPALELLRRIEAERARLVRSGEIRRPKPVAALDEDALPFGLASGWAWTQIARLGVVSPRNEAADDLQASFVPMPLIAADYGAGHQHETRPWGQIKKGYTHFAEGDVGLAKITPCFENGKSTVFRGLTGGLGSGTTELHVVRPLFVAADYIVLFLKSSHFIETGKPRMTGTAGQKRLPKDYFTDSPFPLPPLAEQHRIVAKVDELMALCDRLEETRAAREAGRDELTKATLSRLTAPGTPGAPGTPETTRHTTRNAGNVAAARPVVARSFRSQARFAVDALPALTARADQVKNLRQTILNLAVRGKLVEQNPADEPASELLQRIKLLRASTQRGSSLKVASPQATWRFELPDGWRWTPLAEISDVTMGQSPPGDTYNKVGEGVPLINGPVEFTAGPFGRTVANQYTTAPRKFCEEGDLLICVRGSTTGRTNVAGFRACIGRGVAAIRSSFEDEFIRLFIWGAREEIISMGRGAAFPSVSKRQLENLAIPLPPLAEQRRIVAKVEELMALCDRLETGLAGAEATQTRLLGSLLQESLALQETETDSEALGATGAGA